MIGRALGKAPARKDPRDVHLSLYKGLAPVALPDELFPVALNAIGPGWGMLGNDRYGDCAWAGAAHEHFWMRKIAGLNPALWSPFTTDCVLGDYRDATGFREGDPSTDNGTDVRAGFKYRRDTGVIDAYGYRHRLDGYAAADFTSVRAIKESVYLFGACALGLQMPSSAMDQTDRGEPWGDASGANEGGHYVPILGWDRAGFLIGITWGAPQRIAPGFVLSRADEAWAVLSPDMMPLTSARAENGFTLAQLRDRIQRLAA